MRFSTMPTTATEIILGRLEAPVDRRMPRVKSCIQKLPLSLREVPGLLECVNVGFEKTLVAACMHENVLKQCSGRHSCSPRAVVLKADIHLTEQVLNLKWTAEQQCRFCEPCRLRTEDARRIVLCGYFWEAVVVASRRVGPVNSHGNRLAPGAAESPVVLPPVKVNILIILLNARLLLFVQHMMVRLLPAGVAVGFDHVL